MTRTTIPGVLDMAALAALTGRDRYRPTDPVALAAELRRLHGTGLTARDIAGALGIALPTVLEALGRPEMPADCPRDAPGLSAQHAGDTGPLERCRGA